MLSHDHLISILEYDAETGIFMWKYNISSRAQKGNEAGYLDRRGYRRIRIMNRAYLAHRLAWMYAHGENPREEIDHINHIKSDNRICNLRSVDREANSKNASLAKNNHSGICGVHWRRKEEKWYASIGRNGRKEFLGRFDDKDDAVKARKDAERRYGFHENHGIDPKQLEEKHDKP